MVMSRYGTKIGSSLKLYIYVSYHLKRGKRKGTTSRHTNMNSLMILENEKMCIHLRGFRT